MAEDNAWTKQKIKSRIEENELDLSLCGISKVPIQNLLPFTKVTVLDLSCNKINILPNTFTKLTQLSSIDLSKNSLTELPREFGELNKLKKLDLLQNNLNELPISFHKLKSLQWLDLKANPIQERLQKVVGDCLKPVECQQCAKNIVKYYENIHLEKVIEERQARKLEESRLNVLQREEEKVRQRKREEKKKRIQDKKMQNSVKDDNDDFITSKSDVSKTPQPKEGNQSRSSSSCFLRLLYLLILIIFTSAIIGSALYVKDKEQFHGNILMVRQSVTLILDKVFDRRLIVS